MLENVRRYPIGIQDFEQLRNDDYVYVDKTELIHQLVSTNSVYFFLCIYSQRFKQQRGKALSKLFSIFCFA